MFALPTCKKKPGHLESKGNFYLYFVFQVYLIRDRLLIERLKTHENMSQCSSATFQRQYKEEMVASSKVDTTKECLLC